VYGVRSIDPSRLPGDLAQLGVPGHRTGLSASRRADPAARKVMTVAASPIKKSHEDHLTEVARLVFRSVARTTSWGLSAAQRLAGLDEAAMSEEDLRSFKSLPSMVYYGCKTVEGVLMRSQGVVRSVCEPLGAAYRQAVSKSGNEIASARNWLMKRSTDDWAQAARSRSKLSGVEHQRLWRVINGLER